MEGWEHATRGVARRERGPLRQVGIHPRGAGDQRGGDDAAVWRMSQVFLTLNKRLTTPRLLGTLAWQANSPAVRVSNVDRSPGESGRV